MPKQLVNATFAEGLGTFLLVFFGTGAIIAAEKGGLNPLWVPGVFALTVAAVIYSFGKVSGAHINPAVSIAFFSLGHLNKRALLSYWAAQLLGAWAGSFTLGLLVPPPHTWGETVPNLPWGIALLVELLLTLGLVLAIFFFAMGPRSRQRLTGLAVGLYVGLVAYWAGPYTGASMNPARSFGPGMLSDQLAPLWLYFIAPLVGGLLAAVAWRYVRRLKTLHA